MIGQVKWARGQLLKDLSKTPNKELGETLKVVEKMAEALHTELIHRAEGNPGKGLEKLSDKAPKHLRDRKLSEVEIIEGDDKDLPF